MVSTEFGVLILLLSFRQAALQAFPVDTNLPSHFYDFGPGFGDNVAPVNDDGSTGQIPIAVAFPFYNHVHGFVYISTNGVLSFLRDVPEYRPVGFPLSGDRRMIAPYWADVDTRNHGGRIYYHEYYGKDEDALRVRSKAKAEAVDAFPGLTYTPSWVMVVTWNRVTCFFICTDENTFQLAISTDGVRSYVSFHYGTMTWTKGSLPEGVVLENGDEYVTRPAVVGFNAGDGVNFEMLSESLTENILNVQSTSNIGKSGVRVYRIDNANIQSAGCSNNFAGTLQVGPRYANMLGGKNVKISGPCFSDVDVIKCKFGDIEVDGRVIDDRTAECAAPYIGATGTVPLTLSVNGGQDYIYHGKFVYVKLDPTKEVIRELGDGWLGGINSPPPLISWKPGQLDATHVNITFVIFSFDSNRDVVSSEVLIKSNFPNSETRPGLVDVIVSLEKTSLSLPSPSHGAIRVGPATPSDGADEYLWSDIHDPAWYLQDFFVDVATNNIPVGKRNKRALPEDIQQSWNEIDEFFDGVGNNINDIKKRVKDQIDDIKEAYNSAQCDRWVSYEQSSPADFSSVPPPPCTLDQARNDPNFMADSACSMGDGCAFHQPDAFHCVRSRRASASGASQQACYSESGDLLTFEQGGGTVDRAGVVPWFTVGGNSIPAPGSVIRHFLHDVRSYYHCCLWSDNCDKYSQQRATHDCSNYVPPGSGAGFGDPHIVTLDGFEYTFNALGEFVLLLAPIHGLMVHARTTQAVNGNGDKMSATEWSALAMKMTSTSIIQVQVNEIRGLDVLIDGALQEFDDIINEITFNGGSVAKTKEQDNSTAFLVSFPDATFQIKPESPTRLSFLIQLDDKLRGNTRGLLGTWNKDKSDDLLTANGTTLDPKSSQEAIFYNFGETWRLPEADGLFHYDLGPSYSDYNNRSFIPVFLRPEDMNSSEAVAVCGSNKMCLFDFSASNGDATFALQTLKNAELFKAIVENTKPVVTCGFPTYPPNANVSGIGSLVGAEIEFTCHSGFTLSGSSRIICQPDGTWTAESPLCTARAEGGTGKILVIGITGAVAFLLVIAVGVAAACVCGSGSPQKVHKNTVAPAAADPPPGLAANTGIPVRTGYLGPGLPNPE